jgi:hypothetical protein
LRKGKVEFTPEQVIINALKHGCTRRTAAHLAGLNEATYYEWVKENPEFAKACEQAQAWFLQSCVPIIKSNPGTALKYAQMVGRADEQLQSVTEKVEQTGGMTITVVRDGTAKNNPPAAPPP